MATEDILRDSLHTFVVQTAAPAAAIDYIPEEHTTLFPNGATFPFLIALDESGKAQRAIVASAGQTVAAKLTEILRAERFELLTKEFDSQFTELLNILGEMSEGHQNLA